MSSAQKAARPASPSSAKTPPRSPSRRFSPPSYTEATPLLASQHEETRGGHHQHEEAALLAPPPQEEAEATDNKRTKSWWFWRGLWSLLAALFLALFIKGWVDARDVDVSGIM